MLLLGNQNKDPLIEPIPIPPKPETIESWENEGGQVIPTGSLPRVIIAPEVIKEGETPHNTVLMG